MELFGACFTKDGTTKSVEATNAIEKMKELKSQLPKGSADDPGPQDIYSQVMGKDKNGVADMYGLGVRASDVWGVIPSRSVCHRENFQWKSKCEQLRSENLELKARMSKIQGSHQNGLDCSSGYITSPDHNAIASEPPPLRVGLVVYLRNILNSTEIVAKGRIKSLDPTARVGGEEIGPSWCEVNVQVAIKSDAHVVRRYGFIVTTQDAVGVTVAWPCPFVSVVPVDDA